MRNDHLPAPASYFPPADGRYRVTPDLQPLGTDFGNGLADQRSFQLDSDYDVYLKQKAASRNENLGKYYRNALDGKSECRIQAYIIEKLTSEYPDYFQSHLDHDVLRINCRLSRTQLVFAEDFSFREAVSPETATPFQSGLDALAGQLQEDMAVVQFDDQGDRLNFIHLCFPNHWAAEDKFQKPFTSIHQPVAGMEALNKKSLPIIEAMIHRGPYVRFAWGLASDRRLNHHPCPPPNNESAAWQGRVFNAESGNFYLRVERQTTHGLPDINAALFTIRTYFTDLSCLRRSSPEKCRQLARAIDSMTSDQLAYKGIGEHKEAIIGWLNGKRESEQV